MSEWDELELRYFDLQKGRIIRPAKTTYDGITGTVFIAVVYSILMGILYLLQEGAYPYFYFAVGAPLTWYAGLAIRRDCWYRPENKLHEIPYWKKDEAEELKKMAREKLGRYALEPKTNEIMSTYFPWIVIFMLFCLYIHLGAKLNEYADFIRHRYE